MQRLDREASAGEVAEETNLRLPEFERRYNEIAQPFAWTSSCSRAWINPSRSPRPSFRSPRDLDGICGGEH